MAVALYTMALVVLNLVSWPDDVGERMLVAGVFAVGLGPVLRFRDRGPDGAPRLRREESR